MSNFFLCISFFMISSLYSINQNNQIVTICGGGNEAHALAGMIGNHGFTVNILTRKPNDWSKNIIVNLPNKRVETILNTVTDDASQVIPNSDIILIACPSFAFDEMLRKIASFINKNSIIGAFPGTGGFDYFCKKYLDPKITFFSSQRVPYICQTKKYGHEVEITGYVHGGMKYAINNLDKKDLVLSSMKKLFMTQTLQGEALPNMLAVNLVNSNSLLHTARLYALGTSQESWKKVKFFYGDWNNLSSELLVESDKELHLLYKAFPKLDFSYMKTTFEHYEAKKIEDVTNKIRSIVAIKNLTDPMIKVGQVYKLNYNSRYFTEDFIYTLGFMYLLCKIKSIHAPTIEKIALWGFEKLGTKLEDIQKLFNIKSEIDIII